MRTTWQWMTADEQPMYEEVTRAWMAIVTPADNSGIIRVYAPTKEEAENRAQSVAAALNA